MSRKSKLVCGLVRARARPRDDHRRPGRPAADRRCSPSRPTASRARSRPTRSSSRSRRSAPRRKRLVEKAQRARQASPSYGLAAGVSQSTLDAIAACESGGDPTAVDARGTYYGKYQFDTRHLGVGRRQRQPRGGLARGRAGLPRVAALQPRRLLPLARLRRLSRRRALETLAPGADATRGERQRLRPRPGDARHARRPGALERRPVAGAAGWAGGALIVASAMLFAVWVVAALSPVDLTRCASPG